MVRYLLEWTLLITLGYVRQPILDQFSYTSASGSASITMDIQLSRKTTLQHTFTNYATYNYDPDKNQWGDFSDHSATDVHSSLIGMWCHITASVTFRTTMPSASGSEDSDWVLKTRLCSRSECRDLLTQPHSTALHIT